MEITRQRAEELAPNLAQELKERADREFGDVPIVREHLWAEPDWILLGQVGGALCSFLCIIDRTASVDGRQMHFFGLNNVITDPNHRGKGYSTALNRAALEFMKELDADAFGFLFCADDLVPFYEKLGWNKFTGEVTVWQPGGDKKWQSNSMYYDVAGNRKIQWQRVHLCGPPW